MERSVLETETNRYVVLEPLAEGGMGAIYRGKKIGVGGSEKEVVLKQLLPEHTSEPEFIGLFLREAKLSATLEHANIVRTLDLVGAADSYFIVMEYVRGADLRAVLRRVRRRGQRLSTASSLFVARDVLTALDYAHNRRDDAGQPLNLIHRDISPSNIMLSVDGEIKLTDFGIAKISTHKSVFYRVKGKAGYMSPEQAIGHREIDHRSDLYSVGVCLYEMLSGERLFVMDLISSPSLIYAQPVPPLESKPGMPSGIDDLLTRALAADPDERYQSALEFHDDLVQLTYRNELFFNARDMAAHLRDVCGHDPTTWRHDRDPHHDDRSTELSSEATTGDGFDGMKLTSVLRAQATEQGGVSAAGIVQAPSQATVRIRSNAPVDPRPDSTTRGGVIDRSPVLESASSISVHSATVEFADEAATRDFTPPQYSEDVETITVAQAIDASASALLSPAALAEQPTRLVGDRPVAPDQIPLDTRTDLVKLDRREKRLLAMSAALLFSSAAMLLTVAVLELKDNMAANEVAASDAAVTLSSWKPDMGADATGETGSAAAAPPISGPTALVHVNSVPSSADVRLQGSSRCHTPCEFRAARSKRLRLINVRKKGYIDWYELVDLTHSTVRLHATLLPEPDPDTIGFLVIHSATDANVYADGHSVGRVTSAGRIPLRPGRHHISLRNPHKREPASFGVTIRPRKTIHRKIDF